MQRIAIIAVLAGALVIAGIHHLGQSTMAARGASVSGPAEVVRLYVSTQGSDAGKGDADHPWATLSHADEVAKPGATVIVKDGVFSGDIRLKASGTAEHPITFVAEHKWRTKLVGTGSGDGSAVVGVIGAHVIVKDFEVTGSDANGIILAFAGTHASFNQAIGNYVHDLVTPCSSNAGTAIETGGGDDYTGIAHNDMTGNLVADIRPDEHCAGGHPASGLYAETPDSLIANNVIINAGYGIQSWHAASRITIFGNTLINNLRGITIGAGDSPGGRVNDYSRVQNNIVFNTSRAAIAETGRTGEHNQYISNLIYGDTSINLNHGLAATGTVKAEPAFVRSTGDVTGDYRLRGNSPARGAGLAAPIVSTDFWGTPRPTSGTTDIGASLYGAQLTAELPAQGPDRVEEPVQAGAHATPNVIRKGQASVLTWTTSHAKSVTLNGKIVDPCGTMKIRPTVTTSYKVVAVGPDGKTDWGSATVAVE